MSHFKMCAVGLFGLFALPLFAQIQTGNYTIGGDINATGAFQKDKYLDFNEFNASLSPSMSKCLTDKWLVGVRPILSTFSNSNTFSPISEDMPYIYKNSLTRLGLEVSSRYYFTKNSNLKPFAFLKVAYDRGSSYGYYKPYNGDIGEGSTSTTFLNYQLGLGANYFLKQDVALEGSLSYGHTEVPDAYELLSIARVVDSKNVTLDFRMTNFINLSSKESDEEAPQYIAKGRRTIGGNIQVGLNNTLYNESPVSLQINPKFSQLITDRLMLMGDFNWIIEGSKDISAAVATVAARYYVPVKKRFYVYPQLSYGYRQGNSYVNGNINHLMSVGLGGNYFLSKNIALEATFLQANLHLRSQAASEPITSGGQFGLGNVSLLYFIR